LNLKIYTRFKFPFFLENLAEILRKYNIQKLLDYFDELKIMKLIPQNKFNNLNIRMLLFFCIYINSKNFIKNWTVFKKPKRNTILRRYYIFMVSLIYSNIYIEPFSIYLNYIFNNLTKFYKIKIKFFLTNNNCVNAKFLSRYIARKLKQNYPVKQLLNPIRKELILVIQMHTISKRSYINKKTKQFIY